MREYFVLVVDDEEHIRSRAINTMTAFNSAQDEGAGMLRVETAKNTEDAYALIANKFFHVAFIDLQLSGSLTDGSQVLQRLKRLRPACTRVLLTERLHENRKVVAKLFNPADVLVERYYDKRSFKNDFATDIGLLAKKYFGADVRIANPDSLAGEVTSRLNYVLARCKPGVSITPEEIDYVISRCLGQPQLLESGEFVTMSLKPLSGGNSRAGVYVGQPLWGKGDTARLGVSIVVKISDRESIEIESRNYNRFVKYHLQDARRVELLCTELGDIIGAACYTFAGKSQQAPKTLTDLMSDNEWDRALCVTEQVLGQKDLHRFSGPLISLSEFFSKSDESEEHSALRARSHIYSNAFDPDEVLQEVERYTVKRAKDQQFSLVDGALCHEGSKLVLPTAVIARSEFRDGCESCVSHGDLHGGNVVVGEGDEFFIIDYRDTGYAPRCLDYAILDLSVRLPLLQESRSLPSVLKEEHNDVSVWNKCWHGKESVYKEPWQDLSGSIITSLRKNFENVGPQEYAATCIMACLRLFGTSLLQKSRMGRMRLLCWMSALSKSLLDHTR